MDAAPNERGPPPAYSQFEMRPLAGNTLEEAELLHAMSYVPNWKDAILDRLGSSRCHRTITSFLITCITTTVIGLAFCFVMQYENSYWYKVTLDNDTSLRAVGFRHEDIRPDLLLDNLKLSHRLTFKSQHLFSTRFVPFYLRSIKTKVTVLSDPKFEKLSDKYVKQGNRENFHYQGIVQLILTWNNAEDYLDFNVDRVLFHVQYILIVASSAAGPSKVVKFNKFFTQQIDLEAVLRAGGTVRGSTHILGRVKVPDGLRVEKILKNKKKRIDSSVKFHSGLKVTILNGTTETVYYEVVTLPHRNEVYGRLRLNLPTVISQNSSAHLYVRSSIHQINLKGYTANYTRIFSPFELVRPRPVIYNHMTLSDRFTDASIRAKRAGEKIHTVTIIQIASSLNGTWYQLHLHKTFQVMLDVDAFLKALGQVKCMPLQQLSFGPFTRAEEDILYDDAD